ncbi:MAG TPA: FHA domain-containing protein, partial [Planctomycetota bacterium]|nr:FHA domain-containing protein [Planctomycetota bacterium]
MAKITIIDGPDLGCEYPLPERGSLDTVVIGRDPGADIVLNDQAASREHCRLVGTRQGHRLVDLGSRNRTFVNGEPIEEAFLRDGDVVRIGDTDLRFEDEGAAIETTGVASTIIREIPINGARRKQASFIEGVASSGVKAEDVLDELEELLRGAQELGETSSAPELLERYLSRIASVFDGEHAAFLVRSGEGWVARASYCATSEDDAAPAVSVSQNVVDEAARGPKAVLSTSTAD